MVKQEKENKFLYLQNKVQLQRTLFDNMTIWWSIVYLKLILLYKS